MTSLQLTVPAQDEDRPGVKIKPREVREWLANLPHLDLQRTSRLASEQLRLLNRQAFPGATRLEILGEFLGTYHRLDEAVHGSETERDAICLLLKRLCQDIGFGYKIVANELINKRGGFMETRSLPLALLGSIYTLGLQLTHYYTRYQRAPRAMWGECLALFEYAWQAGREHFQASLPGAGTIQIDSIFRLIALLRLTDPYTLPTGMIPVLRQYFGMHAELSSIQAGRETDDVCFQLTDSARTEPDEQENRIYLHLSDLMKTMSEDIHKLERYKQAKAIGLPEEVPGNILLRTLRQIHDHWLTHPTRKTSREDAQARIELVAGLDASYCMTNRGRPFDPNLFLAPGHENIIDLGTRPTPETDTCSRVPDPFVCSVINRSNGGLAVRYQGTQQPHPRVGQLLALRRPDVKSSDGWVITAVRWLIEAESGSGFELGLQYLAREPKAVVVRVMDATGLGGNYQPAIAAIQKRRQQRVHTLMIRSGEAQVGSELSIYEPAGQYAVRCVELLESGPGFERLIYEQIQTTENPG